jgi:exonuclease VII small subunit
LHLRFDFFCVGFHHQNVLIKYFGLDYLNLDLSELIYARSLLIHGRYSLATADFDTALNHYQEAKQLIEETGYHLRDAELDLFAAQICHSTKQDLNAKDANHYLQKAKNRIEDIGQWGLMPRWEQVNVQIHGV